MVDLGLKIRKGHPKICEFYIGIPQCTLSEVRAFQKGFYISRRRRRKVKSSQQRLSVVRSESNFDLASSGTNEQITMARLSIGSASFDQNLIPNLVSLGANDQVTAENSASFDRSFISDLLSFDANEQITMAYLAPFGQNHLSSSASLDRDYI
ncbi:hypothetical protein V6N13_081190 [Hibiscus sabdariffa]